MFKEKINICLVDGNNLRLGFYGVGSEDFQYAEKILLFDKPQKGILRPLGYIHHNNELFLTKYGKDIEDEITSFISNNQLEIDRLLKIIETDYSVIHNLHKKHQNPKMTHAKENTLL
jgi:hypothetical protein